MTALLAPYWPILLVVGLAVCLAFVIAMIVRAPLAGDDWDY